MNKRKLGAKKGAADGSSSSKGGDDKKENSKEAAAVGKRNPPRSTRSKTSGIPKKVIAASDFSGPTGFARGLTADKIIGATDSSGELELLIKWANSDEADLVPARVVNVKCPQMVIEFYQERLTFGSNDGDDSSDALPSRTDLPLDELSSFDRGFTADKIIGATAICGELLFLMKWKETDEADLVTARQANVKCPQVVIAYYEERVTFGSTEEKDEPL